MKLKSLGRGVWIDPDVIESVIAFDGSTAFGLRQGPHVTIFCRGTSPVWEFDTLEKAIEFAAGIVRKLAEPV